MKVEENQAIAKIVRNMMYHHDYITDQNLEDIVKAVRTLREGRRPYICTSTRGQCWQDCMTCWLHETGMEEVENE